MSWNPFTLRNRRRPPTCHLCPSPATLHVSHMGEQMLLCGRNGHLMRLERLWGQVMIRVL